MKQKLQQVLDRVKEPETHMSISDLGLVERIRHDEKSDALLVFLNIIRAGPVCCSIIGGLLLSTTKKDLFTELQKEFPHLRVKFM